MPAIARKRARKRRKPLPPLPAPRFSGRLYLRVASPDVALFRFLLEAHDNLALFTMLDRTEGVLLLRFSPHQAREVEDFLAEAATEIPITRLAAPA